MADLISLQAVKYQLRKTDTEMALEADSLQAFMDQATAIVLAHCNTTSHWRAVTATWVDEDTTPEEIKTAILRQVAGFNQDRGDSTEPLFDETGLAPGVAAILRHFRDPVVV